MARKVNPVGSLAAPLVDPIARRRTHFADLLVGTPGFGLEPCNMDLADDGIPGDASLGEAKVMDGGRGQASWRVGVGRSFVAVVLAPRVDGRGGGSNCRNF